MTVDASRFADLTAAVLAAARDAGLATPIGFRSAPDSAPRTISHRSELGLVATIHRDNDRQVIADATDAVLYAHGQADNWILRDQLRGDAWQAIEPPDPEPDPLVSVADIAETDRAMRDAFPNDSLGVARGFTARRREVRHAICAHLFDGRTAMNHLTVSQAAKLRQELGWITDGTYTAELTDAGVLIHWPGHDDVLCPWVEAF